MVDERKIAVTQDELDELLATLDGDDATSSHDRAFSAGLLMRKQTIVDVLESISGDPTVEHVSQDELDDLLDTSDTVKMSKAEIVDTFGRDALRVTLNLDSSKILSHDFYQSLSLEPPSPQHSFLGKNLFGGARTLIRKILPTRSRSK